MWDNEDAVCGIKYNGTPYYFLKNLQGDIVAITDANGDVVARYSYDAWGVLTIVSDTTAVGIATVNPFRYRGYYYDSETQLYYLQSRYYNPVVGRFVNADEAMLIRFNLGSNCGSSFSYCYSAPTNGVDKSGTAPQWLYDAVQPLIGLGLSYVSDILPMQLYFMAIEKGWIIPISIVQTVCNINAIVNYVNNSALEKNSPITQYITAQSAYKNWKLGYRDMGYNGCEVISVFNVLMALGKKRSLAFLVFQFELLKLVRLFGEFGSSPTALWQYFSLSGIKYGMTYSLKKYKQKLQDGRYGVVSCWNNPFTTGLHTFMVEYDKTKSSSRYVSYNGYSGRRNGNSLDSIINSDRFIVGYWF